MNDTNLKQSLPVNVLAEPIFTSEMEAYIYYAKKYNINLIQDDALLHRTFKDLPCESNRTEADNEVAKKHDEVLTKLVDEISTKNGYSAKEIKSKKSVLLEEATEILDSKLNQWLEFENKMLNAISKIPLIVAVDTGKYNTKICYSTFNIFKGEYTDLKTLCFESRVSEVDSLSSIGASSITTLNGEGFIVSKQAARICETNTKLTAGTHKAHKYHRFLLAEALCIVYEETGRNLFNVVMGMSLDSLNSDEGAAVYLTMLDKLPEDLKEPTSLEERKNLNKDLKALMNSYMSNFTGTTLNMKRKGRKFDLVINDLIVSAETQSGSYSLEHIENFDCEEYFNTYLIDIGGLNRSIYIVVGGAPDVLNSVTDDKGMARLVSEAETYLVKNNGGLHDTELHFDKAYVERSLKFYSIKEGGQPVDDALFQYFDGLVEQLKNMPNHKFNPNAAKLIFIGGGAQSLQEFIKYYFSREIELKYPAEVIPNGLYSNVIGMYHVGEVRFSEREIERREQKELLNA